MANMMLQAWKTDNENQLQQHPLKGTWICAKEQEPNTQRVTTSILSSTEKKLFSSYAWELESLKHGKYAVNVLEPARKGKGGSNRDEARRSAPKNALKPETWQI